MRRREGRRKRFGEEKRLKIKMEDEKIKDLTVINNQ